MGISWENHGNIMGISWEYHGNIMGKSWKIMGISWENHGNIMGISWENHGKSWEYHGKIMGKSWEYHGKIMGKSWEYHGNIMGISWEYHGKIMGISWEYHGKIMGKSWEYHGKHMGNNGVEWDNKGIGWHLRFKRYCEWLWNPAPVRRWDTTRAGFCPHPQYVYLYIDKALWYTIHMMWSLYIPHRYWFIHVVLLYMYNSVFTNGTVMSNDN